MPSAMTLDDALLRAATVAPVLRQSSTPLRGL
jgi:hypothetical protein